MLLIEYFEEAARYLKERNEAKRRLEDQYRRAYDRDIKKEISIINKEIRKKNSEITGQILLNLDEFRYLDRYFPDLLAAYREDEDIGKVISKKAWLLRYRPVPPREAAMRIERLRVLRSQLRHARKFLKTWTGAIESRAFSATFQILKGRLRGRLEKDEVEHVIDEVDKELIREGWLVLITDSLIHIPIAKFTNKLLRLQYEEAEAASGLSRAKGRGTRMEVNAFRKYRKVVREKEHYEAVIMQVLLANPDYLRSLKRKSNWLSRKRKGPVDKIIQNLTPHTVKERVWLDKMNKKLAIEEPEPKKKSRKKAKKKKSGKKK